MKTRIAYLQSCWKLRDHVSDCGDKLYFWTFTTKEVLPDWRLAPIWKRFIRDVCHLFDDDGGSPLTGIRVLERHRKGNLHYHAIVNRRIPVDEVRKIGGKYGIGRVHVRKVRSNDGALFYLAKYLGKDRRVVGEGCRIKAWGTIGDASWSVKRSDIKVDDRFTRLVRKVKLGVYPDKPMPLPLVRQLMRWKWAGFDDKEDFLLWWAEDKAARSWEQWEVLTMPDWRLLREMGSSWGKSVQYVGSPSF